MAKTRVKSEVELRIKARERTTKKLLGVVVYYSLPSASGILQPYAGKQGGDIKELLPFSINDLQCEGYRAVEKWTRVEFSFKKDNCQKKATQITQLNNTLIYFNSQDHEQNTKWLMHAHKERHERRNPNRKTKTKTWMGSVLSFPVGIPPF